MSNEIALITGSSSGIGLELARCFARAGHQLILTAPVQEELEIIAETLRAEYGVIVHVIAADLAVPESAEELALKVSDLGLEITTLVNNAGRGIKGEFVDIPLERDIEMIRLNIEAVVRVTKQFLPGMKQRGQGRLLFTASIASFEPGPLLAVYHASKAFVLSFSEALATELEDSGLTVTALCPGPVDTDFFPKAGMVETRAFQKAKVMAPQEVAQIGFDASMRGERVIVPGGVNKAMVFTRRFLPESVQAKKNEKYYVNVDPEDHKREPGEIAAEYEESNEESVFSAPIPHETVPKTRPVITLKALLLDELRDLLDAEKQLTHALPEMADAASNEELKRGFERHLLETKTHIIRLKEAFAALGEKPVMKTCQAMKGLIEEGQAAILSGSRGALRDAKLIGAAQRVEHYEIAAYGTARAFAETLHENSVIELLHQTLEEESATDKKLSFLALTINENAFTGS